ncbi:MAG: 2-oxo acid dehydrogenase subunit E2 [Candidatus Margulisiibacteriota bacterium]|nr:2-oxo acid dehydrogenase subunit E2 [Candidatus Margulisiibacteriota bacterium]
MEIKIPFLGDGIDTANVASILVNPGDSVAVDDTVIELETDKATAPVPSLYEGTVESISVSEGDIVKEGMVVVVLSGSGEQTSADAPAPKVDSVPVSAPQVVQSAPVKQVTKVPTVSYEISKDWDQISAAPSIFKFARLSGLDLGRVSGTGHGGRITWSDIQSYLAFVQSEAFTKSVASESSNTNVTAAPKPKKPVVDFSKFGPIETQKISTLRQKISEHLSNAWTEIPHVTQFADIQLDSIMALRKDLNAKLKKNDVKLSVTVFVLKAIAQTLAAFENFNASLVDNELIIKKYIHLGVAVDTDAGLVVPVIRDVDKKSLQDIAKELDELAEKARNKALSLDDIQGATFTLSNLGGLGASHFTPIVNSPEVAILGTGRANYSVSYSEKEDKLSNRLLMPVALSYDHRVIDGADGARFIKELTKNIESFDKKWVK